MNMTPKYIYLLGAGGMGMAPLEKYLYDMGYTVFGWDDHVKPRRQEKLGAYIIWRDTIPTSCDICVYSSAIDLKNPKLLEAKKYCPCFRRGEFLAHILRNKSLIVVCGSHGKSTTTAYLIHLFKRYSIPLNYLLGAEFQRDYYASSEYHKDAQNTLIELDESDGTIELFSPDISVVLNTDWDHPNWYKTKNDYKAAFERLIERTRNKVFTSDSAVTSRKAQLIESEKCCHFNVDKDVAVQVFEFLTNKTVTLHDVVSFPGVKRRQEVLLKTDRLEVISDYAHHPQEIEALWTFLSKKSGTKYVAFEPHRFSRLNHFYDAFVRSLKPISHLFLWRVYDAFESMPSICKTLEVALPQAQPLQNLKTEAFLDNSKNAIVAFVGAGTMDDVAHRWVENWVLSVKQFFAKQKIFLKENYNLKQHSLLGIGGCTLFISCPEDLEQLKGLLKSCYKLGLKVYPLGCGSNVLIPEERFDGVVVQLKAGFWTTCERLSECCYCVGAGCILQHFLNEMEKNGVGGFEFLDGIPGTLGGALSMNAGTGLQGILDCVCTITYCDKFGDVHVVKQEDLDYSYRSCERLKDVIIISAVLKGQISSEFTIKAQRLMLREKRKKTQPTGRSLGCFFKNTLAGSAGKLLDNLGLKNARRGDIVVSAKHANFLINEGVGTYADVIELVRFLHQQVYTKTRISLEPEVRLLGKNWEEIL